MLDLHCHILPGVDDGASCLGESVRMIHAAYKAGITEIVFDRGGNLYHGRIKALADAAREAGLKF